MADLAAACRASRARSAAGSSTMFFSPCEQNIGGGLRLNRGGRPRSVNGYRLDKLGSTAGSKLKRFNGSFCFPRSFFLPAPPQSPSDPPP